MPPKSYYAEYERPSDRCRWCDDYDRQEALVEASARALVAEAEAITKAAV